MEATTDVIVITSSPGGNLTRTPTPRTGEPGTLSRRPLCDPSPMPSSSELFRPLSRSEYVNATNPSDEAPRCAEKKSTTDVTTEAVPTAPKPKRRGRKPKNDAGAFSAESTGSEIKDHTSTKPKTARKKRADAGSQREKLTNKTITGKVAKSSNAKTKSPEAKTGGLPTLTSSPARIFTKVDTTEWENDGLQLEAALKRRLDWTPTKPTANLAFDLDNTAEKSGGSRLGSLLSEYGYSGLPAAWKDPRVIGDGGPTKRRRIELVDPRVCPPKPNSPDTDDNQMSEEGSVLPSAVSRAGKKLKKPAKRLTTITARVTAPYAKSLFEVSDSMGEDTAVTSENSETVRPRARKPKKKGKLGLVFEEPEYIVLSPEAAVQSLDNQDLVFGTCSQLEREDSPTLLRETQIAVRESEKEILSTSQSRLNRDTKWSLSSTGAISRFTAPRNLWSAAARDSEGSLVEAEVLDLVNTPVASRVSGSGNDLCKENTNHEPGHSSSKKGEILPTKVSGPPEGGAVTKKLPALPTQTAQLPSHTPKGIPNRRMPHYDGFSDAQLATKIKAFGFKAIKNRKRMIETLKKCWEAKYGPSNQGDVEDIQARQPTVSLESPSTSQTKRPARKPRQAATGQRQPKERSQPMASNAATEDDTSTTIGSTSEPLNSSKQKTQSKMQSNTFAQATTTRSFLEVEEIQDSEDELIPSPSRAWARHLVDSPSKKQTLPISPSPRSSRSRATVFQPERKCATAPGAATATTNTDDSLPGMLEQITKAVRTQPCLSPNGTRPRPSWHEKILMYDPIILEDFTSWLNTEGLDLVGEDREVGAGFVRRWCESKGICCCFKVRKTPGHY